MPRYTTTTSREHVGPMTDAVIARHRGRPAWYYERERPLAWFALREIFTPSEHLNWSASIRIEPTVSGLVSVALAAAFTRRRMRPITLGHWATSRLVDLAEVACDWLDELTEPRPDEPTRWSERRPTQLAAIAERRWSELRISMQELNDAPTT